MPSQPPRMSALHGSRGEPANAAFQTAAFGRTIVNAKGIRFDVVHRLSSFLLSHPFRGAGFIAMQVPRFLLPRATGLVLVRTVQGLDLLVDPSEDAGVERTLYLCGTYEPGTLEVLRTCLGQGDTFIDIGSNIGVIAAFGSRQVGIGGAVYAFEPEPELYRRLVENLAVNHCQNVHPIPLAMGSARRTSEIYPNLTNRGHTSLVKPGSPIPSGIEVQIETLDDFVVSRGVSGVKLIKIDVEGWELEVLKGCRRILSASDAPAIIIECSRLHPIEGGDVGDIFETIANCNEYAIFKDKRGMPPLVPVHSKTELPNHGNIYCFLPATMKAGAGSLFR